MKTTRNNILVEVQRCIGEGLIDKMWIIFEWPEK
jgi:hypothetical protein